MIRFAVAVIGVVGWILLLSDSYLIVSIKARGGTEQLRTALLHACTFLTLVSLCLSVEAYLADGWLLRAGLAAIGALFLLIRSRARRVAVSGLTPQLGFTTAETGRALFRRIVFRRRY
jgi:hypothetical protein